MNIHDFIRSKTTIDVSNQGSENVSWSAIVKNEKKPVNYGRGERPYHLEASSRKPPKKSPKKKNTENHVMDVNLSTPRAESKRVEELDFSHILPAVRMATGGYHVYSNDAIQRRMKERYRMHAEVQQSQASSDSPNATYVTASSGTSDSFKTAQDSIESTMPMPAEEIEEEVDEEEVVFRKNALMRGVIQANKVVYPDDDPYSDSDDFLDASDCTNRIEDALQDLNLESDPTTIYQEKMDRFLNNEPREDKSSEKIGQLYQSKKDEDLYVHALQERIHEDPQWKSYHLSRRGTETTSSAREYYMNIKDDDFGWE